MFDYQFCECGFFVAEVFGCGLGGKCQLALPPSNRNLARGNQFVQVQGQLPRAINN